MERVLTEEPVWYLKSLPYSTYLRSDHWKLLRERYIEYRFQSRGYAPRCERCGLKFIGEAQFILWEDKETGWTEYEMKPRPPMFNLHHLTYERLGQESFEDLELVCVCCHNLEHYPDSHAAKYWAHYLETTENVNLGI